MEVDSVVALESHFTKLEVASSIGTIFGATNLFGGAKGSRPFQSLALARTRALFNDATNLTLSNAVVK